MFNLWHAFLLAFNIKTRRLYLAVFTVVVLPISSDIVAVLCRYIYVARM